MVKYSLVTGGCGFIGRNLVNRLIGERHFVYIIDDLSIGKHPKEWITGDRFEFINRDVIDFFRNYADLPSFDYVFHLASIVGGRELIEGNPIKIAVDLAIDSIFLNWVTENKDKVKKILYPSSAAAYPINFQKEKDYLKLQENHIDFNNLKMPDMTYGWSKLTGEYLCRLLSNRYDVHVAVIRPFSGYGPDQNLSYPIPAIAQRVARKENPLIIWGDGTQKRDFVYISDVLDAMLLVINKVSDGTPVNIGSGKPTSFIEIAKIMANIKGYSPQIKTLTEKPTGVMTRYSDITLLKNMGWKPKISLETGLKNVIEYQEKRLLVS